jgi:Flp pilus assembly protein TadD
MTDPDDFAEAYRFRYFIHIKLEQFEPALEDLNRSLEYNPDISLYGADRYLLRGELLWYLGKPDQAASNFLLVHELRPTEVKPVRLLCKVYCAKESGLPAMLFADKLLAMDGKNPESLLTCAEAYIYANKVRSALLVCQQWVSLEPNNYHAHMMLGASQRGCGDEAAALLSLEKGVALAPKAPQALMALADFLATTQDATFRDGERGIKLALEACKISGFKDPRCLIALSAAYAECGDFKNAATRITEALARAEKYPSREQECRLMLTKFQQGLPMRRPPESSPDAGRVQEKK